MTISRLYVEKSSVQKLLKKVLQPQLPLPRVLLVLLLLLLLLLLLTFQALEHGRRVLVLRNQLVHARIVAGLDLDLIINQHTYVYLYIYATIIYTYLSNLLSVYSSHI